MLQGLIVALLLAAVAGAVQAQDDRESRLRTVRGTVLDKDEAPVPDAVVYLKNLKNDTIRTTIAGSDGTYRFRGLDPNVDYEVHAEHKENASNARKVSSFDTRREMVIHLKITKKKE
jgi:protocatechuate 3,4-dioxygenase beta subunit